MLIKFRKVARVSTKCRIMGHGSAMPFFIAPAALAKLGHDDGELCLARGAARWNIPYCSSTYSSVAHADIAACLDSEASGGALLFQLYVPVVKQNARKLIVEARRLNYRALGVTVDVSNLMNKSATRSMWLPRSCVHQLRWIFGSHFSKFLALADHMPANISLRSSVSEKTTIATKQS